MSVTLVADIIRIAMRDLGALAAGDAPSADEYSDGVDDLNVMLQSWSADESLLPRRSYSFTVSTSGIAIGVDETLDTTGRVLKILGATLRYGSGSSAVDWPLTVGQLGDYQKIQNKATTGVPCQIFLSPGVLDEGTVYFDRVPDQSYTLLLETLEQFGAYNDHSVAINLPAEYYAPLRYNLAVALSTQYPGLTPFIVAEAKRSKERLQYLNNGYLLGESMPSSSLVV